MVASLAGRDDVDATTVSFLVAENLKLQKKEEEEKERRRKREEAEHEARMRELDRRVWADEQLTQAESYAWRKWAGFLPSEPRRKKKRKKKKLPRAPRPRCGRPCALQRHVPAVPRVLPVCASDPVHLQSVGHSCCGAETGTHTAKLCGGREIRQVQFLVDVDAPVVVQRQGYGQTVQKTVLVPQFAVHRRSTASLRAAEANPHGPACSENHRVSAVAVGQVVDAPVVQVVPCPLSF